MIQCYGARPLKRFIQKNIETKIAREIIAGHVSEQGSMTIDYDGNELVLNKRTLRFGHLNGQSHCFLIYKKSIH